ncbi:hypothetical protein HK104_003943, partial [Borealophlyctis nickersoniae]
MLDCCRPLDQVEKTGINLAEFVCLARCNGLKATLKRADRATLEQFKEDLRRTSMSPTEYLVVSFDRGTLKQSGTGHFSPVGGYNEEEGMVLVLDVARFKIFYGMGAPITGLSWNSRFAAHDNSSPRESLHPIDVETGKPRGYVILSKDVRRHMRSALSQLSQLTVDRDSWRGLAALLFKGIPERLATLDPSQISSPAEFIAFVIETIPDEYSMIVDNRLPLFVSPVSGDLDLGKATEGAPDVSQQPPATGDMSANPTGMLQAYIDDLNALLRALYETELYQIVKYTVSATRKAKARAKMMEIAAAASARAEAYAIEHGLSSSLNP